jgi:acyl-CoA thioesterase
VTRASDPGIDTRRFLDLAPTADPSRWSCVVGPDVVTRAGAMLGGALFAAALVAMEGVAERPPAWATAQYLSHVGAGAVVDVDVIVDVAGHQMTQARAEASSQGTVLLRVAAALGARSFPGAGTWLSPPAVPPPSACDPVVDVQGAPRSEVWELRQAAGRQLAELDGRPGPGASASWCRLPGGRRRATAGDLAIAGDFLMTHFADALGAPCSGNSLDNTLRVADLTTTEWILIDGQVHFVGNGVGHGLAHLWSDTGTLLGTAGQTLVLRELNPDGLTTRGNRRIVEGRTKPEA